MTGPLRRWWRQRIIRRAALDPALWEQTLESLPFMDGLTADERVRLRDTVILIVHDKSIRGAGDTKNRRRHATDDRGPSLHSGT